MSFGMRISARSIVTFALIGANVAFYIYTSIIGGDFITTGEYPILMYGQVNLYVFEGAYWQLFTSMFVHANIVHLAGNMLFLLVFGLRAEELFSVKEYLLIYFLSGLSGNLLTLLIGPAMISVGASGAIFGLFGAVAIYVRHSIGQSIIGALIYSFFLLLINTGAEVNVLAHLGGLVAGLLLGYWLASKPRKRPAQAYRYSYSYSTG